MDEQLTSENRILWSRVIGVAVVAALLVTAVWFVFFHSDNKENPAPAKSTSSNGSQQRSPAPESNNAAPGGGTTPAPAPTNPSTPPGASGAVNAPNNTSTPAPSRGQNTGDSAQLSNTGPGDVVKLFAGTSVLAGVGHYLVMRRQARRGLKA